ncbi:hypothetical protein CQ046_13240 [Chryseobacterium sp. MYb7]|uniref:SDR family NAD(P)-dependent oxidoreductase n=1 Tax=Chryseobacterium sp. MYb7 TaxID=1827290 RepID=UPI000CFFBFE1|nr:SDR family NAD(P)-dependent oxidoreductase [Chryseobacterium sp. MYb7]PRB02200.1 hypothetical protein CQ046_13240 [Chryseobacterium sp. MYb7]
MSSYFDHKVIWITGASSGIGEALVKNLAQNSNAKIILSSRKEEQLHLVAGNAGLSKDRYAVIPLDLQNYKEMPALAAKASEQFGKIDISINAVTGNGSLQGTMDDATKNGMPVDIFAKKMLHAIEKQKRQKAIGGKEVMAVYLKRFFPDILAKIIRKAKVV